MILDTTFLVDIIRGDQAALALLDRLEAGSDPLLIPTPVLYELWEGIERSTKPLREAQAVARTVEAYPLLDIDAAAAKRAGRISGNLIRRGETIDDIDVFIAGIALERGYPLITRNLKHFDRIDGLRVVGY